MEGILSLNKRLYFFLIPPLRLLSNRLGYFLMFHKDVHAVESCHIGIMDISDHNPVQMEINFNFKRKITSWRLNSSLLNGKMKEIKGKIQQYLVENDNGEVSSPFLWDACKAVLRGKLISKSAALKKNKQQELINLEVKLKRLERENKATLDPNLTKEMGQIKTQINNLQA